MNIKNTQKSFNKKEIKEIQTAFHKYLEYNLLKDRRSATQSDLYLALAYALREVLVEGWFDTQRSYYQSDCKRVYYISMEFLMGRTLGNALINLGAKEDWELALQEIGLNMSDLVEKEWDAGLGNGGLGRLAACFLDSMATLRLPAYGYGIRYEYGMFQQKIEAGKQVEIADQWLRYSNPWEFVRQEHLHRIPICGQVVTENINGQEVTKWIDTQDIMALAYDIPIPGYDNGVVNTLRLWSAKATHEFELESFNQGNYVGAIESKTHVENVSKVLYPADHTSEGKELRLRQEYFLSAATIKDILYRFEKTHTNYELLPQKVAIQLNDTHPTLAIAELMRILIDEKNIPWDKAWTIVNKTFAYTNHTVLPEALEKWAVPLFEKLLPRHLQIIYKINHDFLEMVQNNFPYDTPLLESLSIIDESHPKAVRMANLAIVASHSVNGVSALHSQILIDELFKDFARLCPEKFNNKTNGITQRRWLLHANPKLSNLITSKIGKKWVTELSELKKLSSLATDISFQKQWSEVKLENKKQLATWISKNLNIKVLPNSLFDCQTKRIHEYKRQLLNVLHVITRYHKLKSNPGLVMAPRTVIFAGKAAPSYTMAKQIIQLINSVGSVINNDPQINDKLKVIFLPNYNVTLAEMIFPASDLSEQISTAGTEASGTGNMKYALNGALTIGTMDGATIEMGEEIGFENLFTFGLSAHQVLEHKKQGYYPIEFYQNNPDLKKTIDMIANGEFSNGDRSTFQSIIGSLLSSDNYLLLADFASYIKAQEMVDELYLNSFEWTRKSILNSAGMGQFSSDRTIMEYAKDIWGVTPTDLKNCP